MNKILFFTIISLFFFSCKTNKKQHSKNITTQEKEIAKNLVQGAFDHLWGEADSTQILDYHTEDFIILEQGEIWDNNRIKQFMRDLHSRPTQYKRVNKMDYISIEKYGESMQIAYWNDGEFYQNDSLKFEARWLESALAVQTANGWRLKSMHSTRVNKK